MDKLTPQLNEVQLKQNIDALVKSGLNKEKIQEYVNNYTKSSDGNYVLKGTNTETPTKQPEQKTTSGVADLIGKMILPGAGTLGLETAMGAGKGVLKTIQGLGQLGLRGLEKITGKEKGTYGSQEQFFEDKTALEPKTIPEKVEEFGEQVAEFAVPGSKIAKITEGANILTKIAMRAISSGAVASAQEGKIGTGTAVAAGTEAIIPGVSAIGKYGFNVIKRLFKGLGSGLSGVGTDVIDTIVKNPQKAMEVSRQLEEVGNFSVLEKNAKDIVNGVSKIRQEARQSYAKGLESLKSQDINPKTFRNSIQEFLDRNGIYSKGKERVLENVEFNEQSNIKKASNLIDDISGSKLDGFSLSKILNKVESKRYKTATSDERLSFNAFITDLSSTLKKAINSSTNKLNEINKAYSTDLQLSEEIERIFADVEFKNLSEVGRVAQKLENLFSQKGLNPRDIDNFLNRIGIKPEEFRTTEAIRQIGQKVTGANIKGLSFAEILQQTTSAVITPQAVKNISIYTGLSEQLLSPILKELKPVARASLVKLLVDLQSNMTNNGVE